MYKVMLIDDEPFILEGLTVIIDWQKYGLEIVAQCETAFEALKLLQNINVDIVITDIKMPKMNGLELIHKIKNIKPDIKFIILSSYNDFDYVKEAAQLGIENYLLKPINTSELISTLIATTNKISKNKLIQNYINKDIEILRTNILYRWMTNNIKSRELKERADFLKLNIECSSYIVAIIKILGNLKSVSQIYNTCTEYTKYSKYNICFYDLDNDIVLIFGKDTPNIQKSTIKKILNEIQTAIYKSLKINTLITIGNIQHSYLTVYKSYISAKKVQDYRLVMPHSKIIDCESIKSQSNNCKNYLNINWNNFIDLVITNDKENILDFIDNIYEKLLSAKNLLPSDMRKITVDIILKIENIINSVYDNLNICLIKNYKNLFNKLYQINDINNLKNYVKNIVSRGINIFISKEESISPIIVQIIKYLNHYYYEELSLKTFSLKFNVNTSYLGRLFQKEVGETFSNYLNNLRIQKAKQMLINTNLKASEISKKIGFTDSNYFYKMFKKHVGISPTEFKTYKICSPSKP